jgi:Recombinational DNA repair ATPase (RecF pathway)
MAEFPHHETLRLVNFTTFADASFEFSPTINVLVGENGTGKTHVMKVLYAVQSLYSRRRITNLMEPLLGTFQCQSTDVLVRNRDKDVTSECAGSWEGEQWQFELAVTDAGGSFKMPLTFPSMSRPVYIPAIDMMGHTRRFLSTFDEYQIDFDQTHRDIVALLLSPERRQPKQNPETVELLSSLLGGNVEEEQERFYLRTTAGRQPMPLVAEGLRKIATLQQLIRNGFLEPGSVLFWDEPEVNVNPKLMDEIVDVLLRLARSGVQIFLATHSYVILKELDLQATAEDRVRYFALEPTDDGTAVHQTDDYATLEPNPISEQFDSLYDRQLVKSTGRRRR